MDGAEDCAHDERRAPARLQERAFWLLGRAANTAQRVTHDHLSEVGLKRYYYAVLATLDEFGPAAQAQIGRRLGVDPSDMVAALDGLEGEGFVSRERDPDDRRRNRVALTRAGRTTLARFDEAIDAAQRDFLATFSERDEKALIRLLQRIVAMPAP